MKYRPVNSVSPAYKKPESDYRNGMRHIKRAFLGIMMKK